MTGSEQEAGLDVERLAALLDTTPGLSIGLMLPSGRLATEMTDIAAAILRGSAAPTGASREGLREALRNSGIPLARWLPSGQAGHLTDDDFDFLAQRLLAAQSPVNDEEGAALSTSRQEGT